MRTQFIDNSTPNKVVLGYEDKLIVIDAKGIPYFAYNKGRLFQLDERISDYELHELNELPENEFFAIEGLLMAIEENYYGANSFTWSKNLSDR